MPEFKLRKFEYDRIEAGLKAIRKAGLELRDAESAIKRKQAYSELDAALFSVGDALSELKK